MPKIKILSLLIVAALVALTIGGVLEIKVHPEKISGVPVKVSSLVKDKNTLEKGIVYATALKRRGEQFIIQDKEKRLELALLYVSTDAARLRELLNKSENAPEIFLPRAELLIASLEQVRARAEKTPIEVVVSLRKESAKSFQSARQALGQLQELHDEYANIQEEFARLTQSLEKQIGDLNIEESNQESVAGTKDEPNPSKIPLKF